MSTQDYLARLRASLRDLRPEQQAELVEEIAAHLTEVEEHNWPCPLEAEMGEPEDLGRRLKRVHRPDRWLDYLLLVGPGVILFPLVTVLIHQLALPVGSGPTESQPIYYWTIRLTLLLSAALVGIGVKRWQVYGSAATSAGVLIYWLSSTWWVVFALCFREQRWQANSYFNLNVPGLVESIFWSLVLVGLGLWLVILLIRTHDPLLTALALLPCTAAVGNLGIGQVIAAGGFQYPNWRILYWGPNQVAEFVWPALFFLFRQRRVRWLGLLTCAIPLTLINGVASQRYPHLIVLWSLLVLLVLAGWLVDWLSHRKNVLIAR